MSTGRHANRVVVGSGTHDARGGDIRMSEEIGYRMTRLRMQAEHERQAAVRAPRSSVRLWLGHALVAFGRFIEGAGPREEECGSPIRA